MRYDQALVADLIALVQSYGLDKLETSLTQKLVTVQRMLESDKRKQAIHALDTFINQVNAQKGKALTIEQANELTNRAQDIKSAIG
jgi:chitinase